MAPEVESHGGRVSSFVTRCLARVAITPPAQVLDVPCGFGRHASWLAQHGFDVAAIDNDPARVRATQSAPAGSGSISTRLVDATTGLPFPRSSFDIALVIHYVSPTILHDVEAVLRPGAYLIYETFGGHGGNWRRLPVPGAVREDLEPRFGLLVYEERPVGPRDEAVAIKLLAQKR